MKKHTMRILVINPNTTQSMTETIADAAAAANAVILLILVLLMVAGILRIVDIRKEL